MNRRPRRNRKSEVIRNMVEETTLSVKDLIFPMFLVEGSGKRIPVDSMPGIYRYSTDTLLSEVESCMKLGIQAIDVFPAYPESLKDAMATESYNPETFYLKALREIKKNFPEICLMSDVAMDPYSSDGHDGIVKDGKILNDETLEILGRMSLAQADAGVDILGPSDMMDGRVGYIRELLDQNGFTDTSIMSYTAKYASAFYGPFRDALDSAPKFGDKKTYQMNPANSQEALVEADLDMEEGADFLMVKPALAYLDIIKLLKDNYPLPIAAYNVSGEYSMLKASAEKGWLDNDRAMIEMLTSIKRSGAKIILTYFAKEFAELSK
ncbi:porphobilinogen synthase [Algoriphagus ornithinivorans]|uniref:Delta-aminolevulinic acid dehydratase n=1 Tax=Algoriphagus ornithinivorans TaxID=226506 RepID=A0A1I5A5N1_9BACT|nr:porphobilinogen synthase [Algoriphagus ornithinivorans]SFN57742.1 porphobilinogen synthase [Algoriphagus ornithinivorans]